ncbi:hypothetical protein VOLCADRAFT_105627 [Volvox carteri f. nagariensis]|uniref:DUF1499 domain-containing protein n=1 Tax=Volvox carteri f. nagariensis TaxID=3068 RepID=D8U1Y8_VOLCA|nr:uncharacterized protein VOLCADRAFT_105627 [Volvox carteri f. nagariensis]EFJ46193.1 hypothetical protein VOLCADRAFT_105627 [Volvox carteri f. nagariensis]|eukprot:XP_002952640.1 hypothetical protein VOLCADRAFT_105627 [Volvox carteri f. nagariensis]
MQLQRSPCSRAVAQRKCALKPAMRIAAPALQVACQAGRWQAGENDEKLQPKEVILRSVNMAVVAALLTIGAAPRPSNLGIQDYGAGIQTLSLCPSTPNCIATSEEGNDREHYAPPLTYNPQDGRGRKNPATQEQAMAELVSVVKTLQPDGFTPKIIKQTPNYLYVEYESPIMGFIDDVEFWFKPGPGARVEYRSASRVGESDGNINRKRIRAIRQELEKEGWRSTGF